jgi:Bor protein
MNTSILNKSLHQCCKLAVTVLLISIFPGCATYTITTMKQPGTEYQQRKVNSYLWGILQSPKEVTTPVCDSLGSPGLSEVMLRRNFGDYVASVFTLGIWNPALLKWKCSKPCQKVDSL